MKNVDHLKEAIYRILEKYHVSPDDFSGRLTFEVQVKRGMVSIIRHSMVADAETAH